MRLTGFSSPFDIDTTISDLMKVERMPLNRLLAKKQTIQWQQEAYRNMNSKFLELRTIMQDLRFGSNLELSKVTSSNQQAVQVSSGGAASGSHSIEVSQLASNGIVHSTGSVNQLNGSTYSNTITVASGDTDFVLEVGGKSKTITLDPGTYDQSQLQTQLQSKLDAAFSADFGAGKIKAQMVTNPSDATQFSVSFIQDGVTGYDSAITIKKATAASNLLTAMGFADGQKTKQVTGSTTLEQLQQYLGGSNGGFTFDTTTNKMSFTVNGVTIEGVKTDTIDSLVSQVNSKTDVNMSFDQATGKFTFSTEKTGSSSKIVFGDTHNFIKTVGVDPTQTYSGQDAIFKMDGLETQQSSNSFTKDGISYTLLSKTTSPVSITSEQNVDAVVDKIKKFVDKYNELIAETHNKMGEKRYRDYQPLTDQEKEEMSEKQIELWEEKAKSGLLRSDSILREAMDTMRYSLTASVEGLSTLKNFADIGITPSKFYQEHGKLEIDETKLRDAIAKNPDEVIDLFTTRKTTADGKFDPSQSGFAQRLYENINTTIDNIAKKAGSSTISVLDNSTLGKSVTDLEKQISTWDDKLIRKENQYYRQFSAMEQALSKLNSQSSWLTSQLSV